MKTDSGFTLIELAVALVVVTLILGGLLVPLNTQLEQRKSSDTQKSLDEIKEALIGFAVANGSVNDRGIAQALPANWPANNADENSNATRLSADPPIRAGFVSRAPQAESASGAGGEFDDIVVWISPSILFNRMVAAGRLP